MYVVDQLVVTVRKGPGLDAPITGRAKSLDMVNVLKDEGDWVQVELPDGSQGWMIKKYLTEEPPLGLKVAQMEKSNQDLQAKVDALTEENNQLKAKHRELQKEVEDRRADLKKARSAYEKLNKDAGDVEDLQAKYQAAKSELASIREERKSLSSAADDQLSRRRLLWFMAGGAVLLVGWLVGLLANRRRRSGAKYY